MLRKYLWLLLLVSLLLASCGSGQLFGPIVTSTSTVTSTPTVTSTVTFTPTPTSTPTPEIVQPSIPNGLRPENAASQTLENGVWTVKNADGKVTATWNAETKQWEYVAENIKYTQIIVGNEVDPTILEPFLGPLPPDDPATHFKNADGTRVAYGIGPETMNGSSQTIGGALVPTTEIFVRFLGIVSLPYSWRYGNLAAQIYEVPRGADTSIIIVKLDTNERFAFYASPGDSALFIPELVSSYEAWGEDSGIKIANERLIGKMGMLLFTDHYASLIDPNSDSYEISVEGDKFAHQLIDFISGISDQPPTLVPYGHGKGSVPMLMFPESQLPKP